jgi:hypothetical protein
MDIHARSQLPDVLQSTIASVSVCICLFWYVSVFTESLNKFCGANTDMIHTDTYRYRYIPDTDCMYLAMTCMYLSVSEQVVSYVSVSIVYVAVCIWYYLSLSDVSVSIVCVSVCASYASLFKSSIKQVVCFGAWICLSRCICMYLYLCVHSCMYLLLSYI